MLARCLLYSMCVFRLGCLHGTDAARSSRGYASSPPTRLTAVLYQIARIVTTVCRTRGARGILVFSICLHVLLQTGRHLDGWERVGVGLGVCPDCLLMVMGVLIAAVRSSNVLCGVYWACLACSSCMLICLNLSATVCSIDFLAVKVGFGSYGLLLIGACLTHDVSAGDNRTMHAASVLGPGAIPLC